MNPVRRILFWLAVFLGVPSIVFCETVISVHGIGAVEQENLARAEQTALDDSFRKGLFTLALENVSASALYALGQTFPDFLRSRGLQDITQYQITSRSRHYEVLDLTVELKIAGDHLHEWLRSRTLDIPRELRPRIVLMVSTFGPGADESYEWWTQRAKPAYSPFEATLAGLLDRWGENVILVPARPKRTILGEPDLFTMAENLGASLLVTGSIGYTPLEETLHGCVAELHLMDVPSRTQLATWSLSHRGDFQLEVMNTLMAGDMLEQLRARIIYSLLSTSPVVMTRRLDIENLRDYGTYRAIVDTLTAMEGVEWLTIREIRGHSIGHVLRMRGTLEDLLDNLKRKQIIEMDIEITDEGATLRLIER